VIGAWSISGRAVVLLLAVALSACGGGAADRARQDVAAPVPQRDSSSAKRLQAYVEQTSGLFDRVLAARRRWEDADGVAAIRDATEGLLDRERAMLRRLRSMTAPAQVGNRHSRMIAELVAQTRALRSLCAAPRLDTDAVDTEVGRTFDIEQIVNELWTV
jgi:hypothetical protein